MTNGDMVRSMSDGELAEFFCPEKPSNSPWCKPVGRTKCGKAPCRKCMLRWLKQPEARLWNSQATSTTTRKA